MTTLDTSATTETRELRDLARVLKAALGVIVAYWKAVGYPSSHPYRQAVRMIVAYLERRYGI